MDFLGKISLYTPTSLLGLLTQLITQFEGIMEIDVRKMSPVKRFRFADNNGGIAKAIVVSDGSGDQCNVLTASGDYVYIEYKNIDNFIAALRAAKAEWHAED